MMHRSRTKWRLLGIKNMPEIPTSGKHATPPPPETEGGDCLTKGLPMKCILNIKYSNNISLNNHIYIVTPIVDWLGLVKGRVSRDFLTCLSGAQKGSSYEKNRGRKSRDTLSSNNGLVFGYGPRESGG